MQLRLGHSESGFGDLGRELFGAIARTFRVALVNRIGADMSLDVARVGLVGGPGAEIGAGAVTARIALEPSPDVVTVTWSGSVVQALVGLVLGASVSDRVAADRAPTAVDLAVIRRATNDLAEAFNGAVPAGVALKARALAVVGGRVQTTAHGVVEVRIDVSSRGQALGALLFHVPLAWVRENDGGRSVRAPRQPASGAAERAMTLPVDAVVELTRMRLSVGELRDWRPGTVLKLGAPKPAELRANGRALFAVEPGASGGRRSARIVARMNAIDTKRS